MIAVADYGAGNLFSVCNALDYIGLDRVVTDDPAVLERADGVILPGVGAFPDAMRKLRARGLVEPLRRQAARKPFLGICLGMQLLFEWGYEFDKAEGLGLLPGSVERIPDTGLKIPHMGWNSLHKQNDCPLLRQVPEGAYVYFVHSYRAVCAETELGAYAEYGVQIPALVYRDRVFGAQFHPEKSADAGLAILQAFGGLCR